MYVVRTGDEVNEMIFLSQRDLISSAGTNLEGRCRLLITTSVIDGFGITSQRALWTMDERSQILPQCL
jgi:hypothetical protein